jgi:glycosyltransferase involved in cell wall biosynthesis
MKISATIICMNESEKISRCLTSLLPVADELIVVDSGSTDNTVALAKSLGAKVYHQPFLGHIEQKNYAASLAEHPWILSLDADEALSEQLTHSIMQLKVSGSSTQTAYSMNRLNRIGEQWIRHGGWYPDTKVRLYPFAHAHWGGTNPHDKIITEPRLKRIRLEGDLLHYSYNNIDELYVQQEKFARLAAQAMFKQGKKNRGISPFFPAAIRWLKGFILQAGFLDGLAGWHIARSNFSYTFQKYKQLHELRTQNP